MSDRIQHLPLLGILDREMAIANAGELIDKYSPYLEELCNFASNVLGRCEKSMEGINGTPTSLIHLHYHLIQMADGVQVLCSKACFEAAVPLLRSLWEGALSIQYMLDSHFEDRSAAWLACYYLELREVLDSLDLSSEKGQEIERLRHKDKYLGDCDFGDQDPEEIAKGIQQIDNMLGKPKFSSALSKLSSKAKKQKKWYSINGGEQSLRGLAGKLGRLLEYEYLYGRFSAVSHAKDASRTLTADADILYFAQMRSSSSGEMVYLLASGYLIDATGSMATKFRPGESIGQQIKEIVKRHRPDAIRS